LRKPFLWVMAVGCGALLPLAAQSVPATMMKTLEVKKVKIDALSPQEIPALLDARKVPFQTIATANWERYPYVPEVHFRMAYTDSALVLHYRVKEASVRAMATADNGAVWEDACVEFFVMPAADSIYYNMECNCIGTLLVGAGSGIGRRASAPQAVLDKVLRWSSLGREPFAERIGECAWELVLVVPFATFFRHHITQVEGKSMRANFYKCGDKLPTRHYLSWNPIGLPRPNFHCPQFFGVVHFAI
jgi:hypothetical protein